MQDMIGTHPKIHFFVQWSCYKSSTSTWLFFFYPIPGLTGICKCWFLRRGENRSSQRRTSWSKGENQQQTFKTHIWCQHQDLNDDGRQMHSSLDHLCSQLMIQFFQLMFPFFVQPAAKKGADKSGPGAGISVLSEKALFLGQKVRTSLLSLLKTNWPCKLQGIIEYSHEILVSFWSLCGS